ncbi:MAG: hypothetical protein E6I59_16055 [Chloroflexi bacterium]|nr:MAG: hypothetical protein E6I59_16055 [Chloroflexota bacterium]
MDVPTTLTITQAILDWTLLGFLLAWMVTFAVLALRATVIAAQSTQPIPVQVGQVRHDTSGEMNPVQIA